MNDEQAKLNEYRSQPAANLGAGEPQEPAYEENLDYVVIETLRHSKYRIESMGRRIDYLQPKADAFEALLAITRAGDRYGNGALACDTNSDTHNIDRTLEKIDLHMRAAAQKQADDFLRDNLADDLPSSFYEGVEVEPKDWPGVEEVEQIQTTVFPPEWNRENRKKETMGIGSVVICYDPKTEKVTLELEGSGVIFDEEEFAERLEEIFEDEIDDRREQRNIANSDFDREQRALAFVTLSGKRHHASDCATSCAPAMEPGPCDCDYQHVPKGSDGTDGA